MRAVWRIDGGSAATGGPSGGVRPRLQASVALLSSRYRQSRREVAAVCADPLGADLSVGSVDALCQDTAAALASPVADLHAQVQTAEAANGDETRWRQAGKGCWLWVVVTALATVFTIAHSRGSEVIKDLRGTDFAGILGNDRYAAYTWLGAERRQVCWAHLKRDFQALVDLGRLSHAGRRGGAAVGNAAVRRLASGA